MQRSQRKAAKKVSTTTKATSTIRSLPSKSNNLTTLHATTPARTVASTAVNRRVNITGKHSQTSRVTISPTSKVTVASRRRMAGVSFDDVPMGPTDPILGITQAYNADTNPDKINVGVGAYRDANGKPWVLPSVKAAETRLLQNQTNMEYTPIEGSKEFALAANQLVYGKNSPLIRANHIASCQTLSGTGALRLISSFLHKYPMRPHDGHPDIVVSNPTWGNHFQVFEHAGLKVGQYRYWDPKTKNIDFQGLMIDLLSLPNGTAVLLQSCAHNPTGQDPNLSQWKQISQICKERKLFPIFDNAYQGFASGNPEKDIEAVRLFVNDGHQLAVCQSFAKNFGLYGHRVGNLSIVCRDQDEQRRVLSQIKIIARGMYSSPPIHGSRIVTEVLSNDDLTKQWHQDIQTMSERITEMRALLREKLEEKSAEKHLKVSWDHITDQIGMFSYTGLTKRQCEMLTYEHNVYLTLNGRISMSGVTPKNVERLAGAMAAVIEKHPADKH